jgi:drug/metabolite transporter (DMT)-like permease
MPRSPLPAAAWWGFGYVAVFSMWIGFFAWYRGLALGGTVRVSQVQLVQPFLSMLFAVPLLGERLDALTLGFAYVCVFSMWIGFFAWYRGLALGGTVRVSQVQLVQPFLSMMFAVPLLHERLDAMSVGFALAVIATVFVGRRMPVGRASAPPVLAPAVESR